MGSLAYFLSLVINIGTVVLYAWGCLGIKINFNLMEILSLRNCLEMKLMDLTDLNVTCT